MDADGGKVDGPDARLPAKIPDLEFNIFILYKENAQ